MFSTSALFPEDQLTVCVTLLVRTLPVLHEVDVGDRNNRRDCSWSFVKNSFPGQWKVDRPLSGSCNSELPLLDALVNNAIKTIQHKLCDLPTRKQSLDVLNNPNHRAMSRCCVF